jgi:hypothetical protein
MFNKLFATMNFKDSGERKRFQSLFELYMSDIPDNFYVDQFSLSKKYSGTSYEDWVRILRHPAFNTWKSEQIAIIATTATDKALAGGDDTSSGTLNLLKMRQDVLNAEKKIEKPTIIVLPQSLFFEGEDT